MFLKITSRFFAKFRNYDGFKFLSKNVLALLIKKENTSILKVLKISEKSNGRIIDKYQKTLFISKKYLMSQKKCINV